MKYVAPSSRFGRLEVRLNSRQIGVASRSQPSRMKISTSSFLVSDPCVVCMGGKAEGRCLVPWLVRHAGHDWKKRLQPRRARPFAPYRQLRVASHAASSQLVRTRNAAISIAWDESLLAYSESTSSLVAFLPRRLFGRFCLRLVGTRIGLDLIICPRIDHYAQVSRESWKPSNDRILGQRGNAVPV